MSVIIGITADAGKEGKHDTLCIKKALADAVALAGGIPLIAPFSLSPSHARKVLQRLDGLLISGGNFDIHPSLYGEKAHKKLGAIKRERTLSEIFLLKAALKADKPILGICGGAQLLNVHFGGTLYQDILAQNKNADNHGQGFDTRKTDHAVKITEGTLLSRIVKKKTLRVNSTHHQAIKNVGAKLAASALAPDGIIESVESTDGRFILGVQWHPEFLANNEAHLRIFKYFVKACKA